MRALSFVAVLSFAVTKVASADLHRADAGRIVVALGSGGLRLAEGVAIHARDGGDSRFALDRSGTLRPEH
jgi:hypothetical protein